MKKKNLNKQLGIFIVALFCSLLIVGNKRNVQVMAAASTPKVSIVSLDHTPFLEGDSNQFFIASNDYTGKVQYQLFYTCETTMGNNWQLIKTSDMVNGWTTPSIAQEPIKVDISSLNLKTDYYRFSIRVRRYGVKGTFSNSYGDYDYAYHFTLNVLKSSSVNLNGDMKINKNEFTDKQAIKIDGVKNSTADVSYKLHLYDVKNNKWLTNLTEYGKNINYNLSSLPEGSYIVDIWAKTDTSTNKYDGWKLSVINVKKETIPTVDLVSLDHSPFVEGDNNAFYVAAKNYTGKVQYQFFYTCQTTMGNKWELINTDEMTNGWTSEVSGNEPLRVDISSLNLKGEKYRFAIRIKRVGFKGVYSNQYGDYDNAYPFNLTVETQNPMNLNEEILMDKYSFGKNDQLIVKGVKSAAETTRYKLHLYDVNNNKWLTNLTDYGNTIDYDLSDIPEGTYILNTWAKATNSNNKYDGWKLKVINVTSSVIKLSNVENVVSTVKRYERYKMPKTVMATLENGSRTSKSVIWDSEANTKKAGIFEIEGTVLGSDKRVKLTLTVEETFGNTNGNILNLGLIAKTDDYIYYSESGDLNKLYRAKSTGEEITKISDESVLFINIYKGYIYYTSLSDNNRLYKIKLDGTGRKKLTNTGFINTIVQDDWIYCTDYKELNIYKISLDGSVVKKLNSEASINLSVTNDRIYYNNVDDDLKIYRISKDGTGKTIVLNDSAGFISVSNDYIYYLNLDDYAYIYKVKPDGTGKTKVYNNPSGYLNLADNGRLYFQDFTANRMSYIDTLDNENFYPLQNSGEFLNVLDEYVYHINLERLGMFRTKNEGPEALPFGKYYKSVDDVTLNAIKGTKPDLPLYVNAITINDDKSTARVLWDTENVDTSIVGKEIYEGSIADSDLKVKATVNLLTIVSLRDTSYSLSVLVNEERDFPNTTMATLSNGEVREVYIKWEKSFIKESNPGEYSFNGTIDGYEEIFKIKVTVEKVESVDYQAKNDTLISYTKVELPRDTYGTTTSGRSIRLPIEWKYTGNLTNVSMVSGYYNIVNTSFIGNHNFEGTVLGYDKKLNYTVNVFENTDLPTGKVIGKYEGYTLFYANNKIYTINPEGTEQKLIADDRKIPGVTYAEYDGLVYYKGWVYYLGKGNGTDSQAGIYRMRLDGSERNLTRNVHIDDFTIANDCIYYSGNSALYIAKLEESTLLAKISVTSPLTIRTKDNYIYYSALLNYSTNVIMRANNDGSNPTVFIKSKFIDLVGDYIYYLEGNNLTRMKLDGTNKLVYNNISYPYRTIRIQEDYIYYSYSGDIYKISVDGTDNTLIKKTSNYNDYMYLFDGFIYFASNSDYSNGYPLYWISRIKPDGTGLEVVGRQH